MRQEKSMMMLYARSTIWKLLAVFVLMTVVETALFITGFRTAEGELLDPNRVVEAYRYQNPLRLGDVFTQSHIQYVFGVAFVAVMVILSLSGCEFGSKVGYTYRRLGISERRSGALQAVYNAMCLVMLLAVQGFIALALCKWYMLNAPAEYVTNQTVIVNFYNNEFLHGLLPLEDTAAHVWNGILVVCLAITAACFPIRQRRGQKGIAVILATAGAILTFRQAIGMTAENVILFGLGFVCVTSYAVSGVWEEKLE